MRRLCSLRNAGCNAAGCSSARPMQPTWRPSTQPAAVRSSLDSMLMSWAPLRTCFNATFSPGRIQRGGNQEHGGADDAGRQGPRGAAHRRRGGAAGAVQCHTPEHVESVPAPVLCSGAVPPGMRVSVCRFKQRFERLLRACPCRSAVQHPLSSSFLSVLNGAVTYLSHVSLRAVLRLQRSHWCCCCPRRRPCSQSGSSAACWTSS